MPPYNVETPISIDDAIRHGKTCAPIKCDNETVCFVLATEVERLRAELECERMRLAACGVVALANTPDSATKAREMHKDYRSASCDDVQKMVDLQINYRNALIDIREAMFGEVNTNIIDYINSVLDYSPQPIQNKVSFMDGIVIPDPNYEASWPAWAVI